MQLAKKKGLFLDLDIQLFGDDPNPSNDPEPTNGTNPNEKQQKYSDEDYLKLKASFDKTSSEMAELKKLLKGKQTEDEKKAEEEASRQKEVDDLKKEVATYKIQSALQESFEKEEIDKISKSILDGDADTLVKVLVDSRKAYKTKIYAEAKEEFSRSAKIPGGNGGDEIPTDIQEYINGKKSKGKNAKDYFFGNKSKEEK